MDMRRFNRIESLRRSAIAGGGFLLFGIVAVFGLCVPLPILLLVTPRRLRARRVRGLASVGFRLLIRIIEGSGLARIEVRSDGIPDLAGCLLVANHPSYLDAVFLMAHLPHVNCVMKSSLLNHPLFFPFSRLGGYIASDNGDPQKLIDDCRAASARGEPILIFPEGTRSTPGAPLHFRRGAAQVALRAGLRIVPLVVHCDPPALTHGHPWYRMPDRIVHLVIRFAAPCDIADFAGSSSGDWSRLARQATRGLENYFIRQLSSSPHEPLLPP
jgi:1-acyl-sn-glycerol-3-phosphate acyltransferase